MRLQHSCASRGWQHAESAASAGCEAAGQARRGPAHLLCVAEDLPARRVHRQAAGPKEEDANQQQNCGGAEEVGRLHADGRGEAFAKRHVQRLAVRILDRW